MSCINLFNVMFIGCHTTKKKMAVVFSLKKSDWPSREEARLGDGGGDGGGAYVVGSRGRGVIWWADEEEETTTTTTTTPKKKTDNDEGD